MARTNQNPPRYLPVWNAYDYARPWQVLDTHAGDVLREPPRGRLHQALRFQTSEQAWKVAERWERKEATG